MKTCKRILVILVACWAAQAQTLERRATITGGRGDSGKCTIEVEVDGVADVEIRGDRAVLRTVSGNPAQWRRFQCTGPLPVNPAEFSFTGIDGRGRQDLVQDPRSARGVAVVRIEDPRGGSEGYTFDVEWRGVGPANGPGQGFGRGPERGLGPLRGFATADAISACLLAVERRGQQEGYRNLRFGSVRADDRPGRADWIVGVARGQAGLGGRVADLEFACSGNLETGNIRAVELNPR